MKYFFPVIFFIAALSPKVAAPQSSSELQLFAQRTAPLNDQYDKWRAEWGDRHLGRRNDPDIKVLNFFELGEFDIAERKLSSSMGDEIRFGFYKISSCRYQRVTLEKMTNPTEALGAKRWVSRFVETVDLNNVNWKDVKISKLLVYTTLEINTNMTSAVNQNFEELISVGTSSYPSKLSDYEIKKEYKERPENVLVYSADIEYSRMSKAAQILMKECPGKTSPF